jgi:ATP-dependent helicase/nuclease subunit B
MGADMLRMQASDIHSRVQQLLQAEALKQFGLQPAPAVQIQLASAKARLHAYARVQAASFAEGWIIRDVERKLRVDDAQPLMIGPLPLSGMIDRIEQHAETGALRIMDFKTFSAPDKPLKTHLAPLSHNWLDSALVEIQSGTRIYQKTWSDLQLPLYRRILEHWYPAECEAHPPETAYFLLPSDPNETGIATFEELDTTRNPDAYASALNCAEAVAKVIHAGRFWPPQPFRASWNDPAGPIFVNGSPEDCVSPESIALLKGGE